MGVQGIKKPASSTAVSASVQLSGFDLNFDEFGHPEEDSDTDDFSVDGSRYSSDYSEDERNKWKTVQHRLQHNRNGGSSETASRFEKWLKWILRVGAVFLALIACFLLYLLLMITMFFSSTEVRFRGVVGWHLLFLFSYCIVSLILLLIYKVLWPKHTLYNRQFAINILCVTIIMLVAMELCFWFLIPTESFLPLEPLNSDALSPSSNKVLYRPDNCNIVVAFDKAKHFFSNSSLDPSSVKVIFGGLPYDHAAFDNTIYLSKFYCPENVDVNLVHELTIVWQFQQDLWFGSGGMKFWEFLLHIKDKSTVVNMQMMREAREKDWNIDDFDFLQQADIVSTYYYFRNVLNRTIHTNSNSTSNDYLILLKHYADQILLIEAGEN